MVVHFSAMLCLYHANSATQVRIALESALVDQTLVPSELIVICDGTVDQEVLNCVREFEEKSNIVYLRFPKNRGHGPARAAALSACSNAWIAIIDADDQSLPQRFEKLFECLQKNPEATVIGGGLLEIEDEGNFKFSSRERNFPKNPEEVKKYISRRSPVAQPTCMLKVKDVLDVGNYQTWHNNEDYHLWIRLVAAGYEIHNTQEIVLRFNVDPDLFLRRGGFRYWLSEAKLQFFSLRAGTSNWFNFIGGSTFRFIVQVVLGAKLRSIVYRKIIRRL